METILTGYYSDAVRKLSQAEIDNYLAYWRFKGQTPWLTTNFSDGEFPFSIKRQQSANDGYFHLVIVATIAGENRWDGTNWRGVYLDSALHSYVSPDVSRTRAMNISESIILSYWDKMAIGQIEPKTRTTLSLDSLTAKWAFLTHCIVDEYFSDFD